MKMLMCRPDFYGVEYEINPWMDKTVAVKHSKAIQQWEFLYQTLKSCGAQVELVTPEKGVPDLVFTANAGLLYEGKVILSHFKCKERQPETPYFKDWFLKAGFEVVNDPGTDSTLPYFEGAGDALAAGNKLFAGYGFRTDRKFYEQAPYFDQKNLVYCELVDPYFYHIDTCFCPLNDKQAIWYPAAFSKDSQKRMAEHIELLAVQENEAKHFACNAVVLNKQIIIPSGCPQLSTRLEEIGFKVYSCEMTEYLKAGGACKCLTLYLGD